MKFSYNLLRKSVDLKLTPEELAEVLTLKTTEVEKIEKVGNDYILEIKILPNRSDLLSHYGLARDIAAVLGSKLLQENKSNPKEGQTKTSDLLSIKIEDSEACPRYCGRVIRDIKVGDSPEWLKIILISLGLRPINNIVDVTNYVMLELGQPLHAFDFGKLEGTEKKQITVRQARKDEKIRVLDEAKTEYELDENMLLITGPEKLLAIAGIKGGTGSEISGATHTIVIESANFNPISIRRTSTRLGLRTDASIRFSYGLDPNLAETAINRAAQLIQEVAGGEIAKGIAEEYLKKLKPWKISVKKSYINSLIGTVIPEKEINKILSRICQSVKSDANKFVVTVPTHRLDLQTPEDIIEEVARIYGYENIKPVPPAMSIYRPAESRASEDWDIEQTIKARNLMKDVLKGLGLSECYNYSFLSEKAKEIFNASKAPEIANPISQEAKYLRTGLIPGLVLATEKNLRFSDSVRLFETGNVFTQKGGEVEEMEVIAGVIASKRAFIELKGAVESFLRQLGIDDAEFSDVINPNCPIKHWYHPGRVAEVQIGEQGIGLIGDLHPHIKNELGIRPDLEIAQFSLLVAPLVKVMEEELEFEPIPRYPSIIRDISLLVSRDVKINEILNCIEGVDANNIVQDVDVFDVYEDNPDVPEGKKSIAFHIIYRSDNRTLTDEEAEKIERNIKKALEQGFGAEIR